MYYIKGWMFLWEQMGWSFLSSCLMKLYHGYTNANIGPWWVDAKYPQPYQKSNVI